MKNDEFYSVLLKKKEDLIKKLSQDKEILLNLSIKQANEIRKLKKIIKKSN